MGSKKYKNKKCLNLTIDKDVLDEFKANAKENSLVISSWVEKHMISYNTEMKRRVAVND